MADYNFPIPHPRGFRAKDDKRKCETPSSDMFNVNDLILTILQARLTSNNGTVHEFETIYDADNRLIELDIPSCYLDYLETVQVGPNIKRYLRWLVGTATGAVADNLVWASMEELIQIDPMKVFETPHEFYPNTLAVFINGNRVEQPNDDGWVLINDKTFELKEDYPDHFRVSVGYLRK